MTSHTNLKTQYRSGAHLYWTQLQERGVAALTHLVWEYAKAMEALIRKVDKKVVPKNLPALGTSYF